MEEIELTFLPKSLPNLNQCPSKEMLDIYVPESAKHPHLRIRKQADKYEITKKQPVNEGDSSHQLETTIPITKEEYADLEKITGKRVYKTRYYYQENGISYEIDVFNQDLEGLVLVDIEFNSLEEKSKFSAPEWLLVEVTQEDFIAGGMLCGKKYQDIEQELKKYSYDKILKQRG